MSPPQKGKKKKRNLRVSVPGKKQRGGTNSKKKGDSMNNDEYRGEGKVINPSHDTRGY